MKTGGYEIYTYILPLMNANMFVLVSGENALVIDPNKDDGAIEMLKNAGARDVTVILTHEHFDHISGVNRLRELMSETGGTCKVYANAYCAEAIKDADKNFSRFFKAMFITRTDEELKLADELFDTDYTCEADVVLAADDEIGWEDLTIRTHDTPGHSPGSICAEVYDAEGNLAALVTGDSLVEGNTVITRLPRGSKSDYKNITRPYLESFPPDTLVLPGHGEISYMKDLKLG